MIVLIITRCSRLQYLEQIHKSIIESFNSANRYINFKWHIIFDLNHVNLISGLPDFIISDGRISYSCSGTTRQFYASNMANEVIFDKEITKGCDYAYLLDDDNLLHPDFCKLILNNIKPTEIPYKNIVFFTQQRDSSTQIRIDSTISPANCVGYVDSAQFLLPIRPLVILRGYENGYCIDGLTIKKMLENYIPYIIIDEVGAYYNKCLDTCG